MSSQTQGFRLSPQQRRVWAAREGAAYCCQCAVLLEGRPKTEALKTALGAVVDGHEILRTTFVRAPGMRLPVQVVGEGGYAWRQADLSRRAAEPTEDLADELLREERDEPFDPARGPCLRAALFTLEPERHLLLLTLPSLCADARTLHNLARAVGDAYASGSGAADVAVQYVEFAEWQNEVLEDEQGKAGRQFWQNPADADPHPSPLPSGVGARRYAPASVGVEVGPEVRAKLERAAARLGVSRSAFLLACWQTLLSRLTDARPLVVGTVFDGRKYEELGDAVGPFAKRLPVEANVGPDARFSEVASEAARALGEAGDWQEYFDPAATESEADAPAGVFGFAFEEWPAKFSAGGLAFSIVRQYVCFDPRQVELVCAAQGADLTAELLYDAGAVGRERALLLASQFAALLESAAERPEAPVTGLNFLSEGERSRLLYEWNATRADYPSDVPVHRLFEEQAARTPGATAVVYADTRLSYAELNERANRLARRLLKHGVERDGPVGLFVERTPEMVVGLLGIMKAGAAYVPLDPTHPPQRLGFMLEDAGARLVVAQRKLADALPPRGLRVLFLDAGSVADESGENVGAELFGDNLAYVIYTSGSTGKPKGVAVTHRGLANYLHWCTRAYDAAGGEGSPVHSPLGFDLTVTSLFTPLLAGRAVVLIPEGAGVEGLSEALLASGGFSLVKITPPHLEVLNYLLPAEAAAGRARALVIGGEALKGEAVAFWREHAPETRLINEYGPTETVVGCCVYEVAPDDPAVGPVPIGRPIANTRLYVLGPRFEPAPTGVAGELYVGGAGLARGYLNRPELTAERFLPDPFSKEPGARLYRTGDIVRYRPGGNLEYVGRADEQVKVRGFRIELGEIESALAAHPGVREAAVLAREDKPGEKRLTAYFVAESAANAPGVGELRAHLSERLPDYMVPHDFVMLESLPLTPNGKVDRRALPAPDQARPLPGHPFVEPRDETERALAEIWQEVLGVERVGADDNFFELGGHSLLATQVVSRVRKAFNVELPLRSLFFEAPTVSRLARVVEERRAGGGVAEAEPVEVVPRREEAELEQLLSRIDQLSDEEVEAMIQEKRLGRGV